MSNAHLNNNFLNLARELDIMDAKTPEDVYKSHLDNVRPVFGGGNVDSARQNLASCLCRTGVAKLGTLPAPHGRGKDTTLRPPHVLGKLATTGPEKGARAARLAECA